jgi:hypothetical protein
MLRFMRYRLLSPRYPATKSTKAKRIGKTLISAAGFFAFFCLDSGGDILMLVPHERSRFTQAPNFVGQACMASNLFSKFKTILIKRFSKSPDAY